MLRRQIKNLTPVSILNRLYGRHTRAFAVGTPKSGTTSIAGLFSGAARSGHEPHRPATVTDMHGHFVGQFSDEQLMASYRQRDKQLMLALESNCFLSYRPDLLHATFPLAKFIVTVRNPLSWLESIFDNNLNFPREKTPTMTKWHQVFFQEQDTVKIPGDAPLIKRGLYALDTYLAYWARTNEICLNAIPAEQRIVIGTNQISHRTQEIGEFVGMDLTARRPKSRHRNKTSTKHNILQELDNDYVAERIEALCRPLVSDYKLNECWSS